MKKDRYIAGRILSLLLMMMAGLVLAPAAQAQLSESQIAPADVMDDDFFGESIAIDGNRLVVGVRTADIGNLENPGAAYVFERIDGQWQEVQKLTASSRSQQDFFGESVALEGDWLFIGAMGNDDEEQDGGAVYVFKRNDGQWEQEQILYPDDRQDFHGFGWEIALQGDRVLVGAPLDEEVATQAGAVYMFERDERSDEWEQTQKILPQNIFPDVASFFGTTMGLDGEHLIVGSPTDREVDRLAGAAYLFRLNRGRWEQTDKLLPPPVAPPDSLEEDTFAREVALDGDWAFAGSFDDEACINKPLFDPENPNSCVAGAVFAYQRQGNGDWEFQQKIIPEELEQFDYFGAIAIAVEGDYLTVGSRGDDDACPPLQPEQNPLFCDTGAAYLFKLVGNEWQKMDKFTASDADSLDFLGGTIFSQGRPLGISGSHIAAGAPTLPFGQNPAPKLGAAYIFKFMNQDPVALDDDTTASSAVSVSIEVLANDSDPDADALSVSIATQPANGTATANADGTITYTSNAGFGGQDTFTYTLDDGDGGTDEATVTVDVSGNSPPSAPAITNLADEEEIILDAPNAPFTVEWTASTDPEGDALTYNWELSETSTFDQPLVVDTGSEPRYATTEGEIGMLLTQNNVNLDNLLWHRAVADDGTTRVPGPALKIRFTDGRTTAVDGTAEVPTDYLLHQNYPNPFNPATQLRFGLPQTAQVRLTVFDVLGREVAVLVDERLPAGWHEAVFEAGDLPSGVYLYQLEAEGRMLARTMLLLK